LPPGEVAAIQGSLASGPSLEYRLPQILGVQNSPYADRTTLVVGSGHSAATNVVSLATLQVDRPETRVIWLTRRAAGAPMPRISGDPLRERDRLAVQANELACSGRPPVTWKPGFSVRRLNLSDREGGPTQWTVHAQSASGSIERFEVDNVIANVGFRPDRWMYEELHVHECYATQGPMKLAAKLLGETGGDCLDQRSHGPESLCNPEPNFFILGSKSYGRNSNFLLQVGLDQIEQAFQVVSGQESAVRRDTLPRTTDN
jgi:hypothetical protein